MKIICIGNFVPRQCGIATFTKNLVDAILKSDKEGSEVLEIEVIAMNDRAESYDYPSIVKKTISVSEKQQYLDAAEYINQSGARLCLLQHEYGIYGGDSGLMILALLRKLRIPLVTTLHTVLKVPNFHQREVLKKICEHSSKVVVMSNLAQGFLQDVFHIPSHKIIRIDHGAPDFGQIKNHQLVKPILWENRSILFTFGLIGRNKGIETVIKALPAIASVHPEVLYVVLGKTHPNVLKHVGEEYREYLEKLIGQLELQDHVLFMDQYLGETELMNLLKSTDIYVTPYLNEAQITSGTLSYAIAGGCAVVSTPYWHARELLADGRGWLFPFENFEELANLVNRLLENPDLKAELQRKASDYGKTIAWPVIGKAYLDLFNEVKSNSPLPTVSLRRNPSRIYPKFDIIHLERLTDETGLLQHASANVPFYRSGYCLDDNSRALIVSLLAWNTDPCLQYESLIIKYLSYILFMSQKDGSFNNYLTYEKTAFNDDKSDDAYGRTVWALGYLVRYSPNDALFTIGHQLFNHSLKHIQQVRYIRGFANCIFGLYHYIRRFPDQDQYQLLLVQLADELCSQYRKNQKHSWNWFEQTVTYDNGLLPAALYQAYTLTRNPEYLMIADDSCKFLESKCFIDNWLSLIGNRKWLRLNEDYDLFAQQPVDAMAMVVLYDCAWRAKSDPAAIDKLLTSFNWFFGENDLNLPVYDDETKGCSDGIEECNINRNQGAESTIAYLLSSQIASQFIFG